MDRKVAEKRPSTSWMLKSSPSRTENHTKRHRVNHKTRWAEYQELSPDEKPKVFDVSVRHVETLYDYLQNRYETERFVIRRSNMDIFVTEMIWCFGMTEKWKDKRDPMRCFYLGLQMIKDNAEEFIQVKTFTLVIRFVGSAISFKMTDDDIQHAQDVREIRHLEV